MTGASLHLDARSGVAPYLQIIQQVRAALRLRALSEGDQLPTAKEDGRGRRQRIKRKGRTKQIVKDKLIKAVDDLEAGIEAGDGYSVEQAVEDWLARGTRDLNESTITTYRFLAEKNLIPLIGAAKLKGLSADDVDTWLEVLADNLPASAQTGHRDWRHDHERDLHQARGASGRMTGLLPLWLPQLYRLSKNEWAIQDLNL